MLFKRYKEVTDRCLELGAKMDTISNEEGAELRRLLEEQAWLSKNIARQANGALEEVRQALEHIESWVSEASGLVERALDQTGIPSDILALEDVISQAAELRDRARNLMLEGDSKAGSRREIRSNDNKQYPQAADIRIDYFSDEDILSGEPAESKIEQEINTATEEVAASSVEPLDADVEYFRLDDDNTGEKGGKVQKGGQGMACEQDVVGLKDISLTRPKFTVFQSPEPMTYKLSRQVVDSLEKKLSPELLSQTASVSETMPPENSKPKPKKARAKKTKKKKK